MRIGFIGAGNMGSALARAASRCKSCEVYIYDKDTDKARTVAKELSAEYKCATEIASECDYIFLGVKPNIIPTAIDEIKDSLNTDAVIVSMAAGVKIADIQAALPTSPIIRIMPNTPCAVGMGMILWCKNERVSDSAADGFLSAMDAAGKLLSLDESLIDAGTAVSGCGPAFVYMFIDAMARGGAEAGLAYEDALTLAASTAMGAAKMIETSGKSPEDLRIAVCSPGGSTIEGVKSLFADELESKVKAAIAASYKRTKELGK